MAVSFEGLENRFAVPDIIAMESLYRLKHHLVLPKLSSRVYEKYFEKDVGKEITVKRPFQAKVASGRTMVKQEMIDKTVTIKIDERYNFALGVVDEDVMFHIKDYSRRYLDVGAEELGYKYDISGAEELGYGLFLQRGTPGTALSLADGQSIRAMATEMAIPENSRNYALLSPWDIAQIQDHIRSLDMPSMVGDSIRKRFRGEFAEWSVYSSVHIPHMNVAGLATGATPLVRGAQRGDDIDTDGWGVNNTKVLNKGQLITIAGVNAVQPRGDRRDTGRLMTFLVTEDATTNASGQATVKIYPEINSGSSADTVANPEAKDFAGNADANLDASAYQTVTAAAADNAAITVIGRNTANGNPISYRQGIFFCGDALEYLNVTLAKPKSAVAAGTMTDEETGVSIAYVADFDIKERTEQERLDIMFGTKTIYPELGIRHIGATV